MSGLYDDLGQLARLAVNAAADAVTGLAATLRDTLNPCDLWSQPVGEYPDLPNVPAPAWATAPAPVPGGATPAAAGDQPTSELLDEAATQLNSLGQMAFGVYPVSLDDLITELHERAELLRRIETHPLVRASIPPDLSGGASKHSPAKRDP